jgi:hypothetical protein
VAEAEAKVSIAKALLRDALATCEDIRAAPDLAALTAKLAADAQAALAPLDGWNSWRGSDE